MESMDLYNGVSNMRGKFNGVEGKFEEDEPRASYTHCYPIF